jgi:hypothetical protein
MDLIHTRHGDENLDALPYIDIHYEGMKDKVHSLIEQEMRTFSPPNYLAHYEELELKFAVVQTIISN